MGSEPKISPQEANGAAHARIAKWWWQHGEAARNAWKSAPHRNAADILDTRTRGSKMAAAASDRDVPANGDEAEVERATPDRSGQRRPLPRIKPGWTIKGV